MNSLSSAKTWRMQDHRYRLFGSICTECQTKYYPFRNFCTKCHDGAKIQSIELCPSGNVISWSCIYAAPFGFENYVPYIIALIKLDDGPIILSQICDIEEKDISMGAKVKTVFRRLEYPDESGIIKYGIKFELLR